MIPVTAVALACTGCRRAAVRRGEAGRRVTVNEGHKQLRGGRAFIAARLGVHLVAASGSSARRAWRASRAARACGADIRGPVPPARCAFPGAPMDGRTAVVCRLRVDVGTPACDPVDRPAHHLAVASKDSPTMIGSAPPLAVPPDQVRDVQLWWFGRNLADRHRISDGGGCDQAGCRPGGRCWVRSVAEQLMTASQGSWPQRWTARLDARSCGLPVPDASPASTGGEDLVADHARHGVPAGVR